MTKAEFIRSPRGVLSPPAQIGLFLLPRRREFLLAHAEPAPKRVLDVGCATGLISLLLMSQGHHVVGIELNSEMAAQARERGVEVIEHDLERPLPLPDASFDLVHACEILEHLFDTEGFLREIHRVLAPGGILVLSTPNLNSLMNRVRVLFGRALPMWGAFPQDRHGSHVRVFNRDKVFELLARTGFHPEVVTGMNQGRLLRLLDHHPAWSEMILVKARLDEGPGEIPG